MSLERLGACGYPAASSTDTVLVLAHGAGAGQRHPFMVATAHGLAARGISIVTFDFRYMQQGRRIPDRAPMLEERFREVIEATRQWSSGALFVGGKSMGGRIATHLGATPLEGLSGVVVFGYPLHPPGKPEQLRVAHLPSLDVPMLIVQGEHDAFGTPNELAPALQMVPTPVDVHVVEGGDHSLKVRGRSREDVSKEVLDVVAQWMASRKS